MVRHAGKRVMRRRRFIGAIGSAALAWPFAAISQTSASPFRIAFLGAQALSTQDPKQIQQFKVGLAENGLIEGQYILVEYYWAEGNPDRLRQLAKEISQRELDVVVTAGPQPIHALIEAKVKPPIVFAIIGDPVSDGFAESLARPGGNITGLSMSNIDLEGKRLEILKEAVPALKKAMLLHDPSMGAAGMEAAKSGAHRLGLELAIVETGDIEKIALAIAQAKSEDVAGLATMASPFFNFNRKRLIAVASRSLLPSIWEAATFVDDGGLLAYGPSFPDMYRRSAGYVARILRGSKASDLPIEQPVRFELAVNIKTAKALGVPLPPTLLARADQIVE
jgi:putative ABC transport system substrate-binding protein